MIKALRIKKSKRVLNIIFLLLLCSVAQAQNKYWVIFRDKGIKTEPPASTLGVKNLRDQPLAPQYLKTLEKKGCSILNFSKWLNAVSVNLPKEQLASIQHLPFVKNIRPVAPIQIMSISDDYRLPELSYGLDQMRAGIWVKNGFTAKGIKIGIIDAGFLEADQDASINPMINKGQVKYFKDLVVRGNRSPYESHHIFINDHGTNVWQLIGGLDTADNQRYGLASDASFYLIRSEQGHAENRQEEDNWIRAVEIMDSLGVKLVNSSLGYSIGFDNPKENHKPREVDGKSSMITQAAEIAAKEKGMLLVISAGNDGNKSKWKIISLPADAPDVLTVGATQYDAWAKSNYSGIGPEWLDDIKPNVVCYADNGTSFSAPVITGLAAVMWQMKPSLSNTEIIQIMQESGNLFPFPNNYVGYGVPNAHAIYHYLQSGVWEDYPIERIEVTKRRYKISKKEFGWKAVAYFKKDAKHVVHMKRYKLTDGDAVIKRKYKAKRVTVTSDHRTIEIIWK